MVGQSVARKEHSQREGTKCEMQISEVTNGNTTHGDTWIESTEDNKMPMAEQGIVRVEQSQRERNQSDMRKVKAQGDTTHGDLQWIHNRQDAVVKEQRWYRNNIDQHVARKGTIPTVKQCSDHNRQGADGGT